MTLVLTFAVVLFAAVLVSDRAHRTVLSTAVLFLAAGFALGQGVGGIIEVNVESGSIALLAEIALFAVLFTDGMKVGVRDLTSAWKLPGRALLIGLPLTIAITALLAHTVVGLGWLEAFLLGAALGPTDPVFAAAIVGRDEIPWRVRHLLNVESGLNDGLALPMVVILLAVLASDNFSFLVIGEEVLLGVAIGVAVPWVAIRLERTRLFSASVAYEPLNAFAIGLTVLGLSSLTHANEFLAAFAAGVTVATMSPATRDAFHHFGELVAELLKLAALLLFGALISPTFLGEIPWTGYVFAVSVLLIARPLAMAVSLLRTRLRMREFAVIAWFGPKGFASVVYGLIILESGVAAADQLFHLIALVVVASILAHSSTDVVIARWFEAAEKADAERPGEVRDRSIETEQPDRTPPDTEWPR